MTDKIQQAIFDLCQRMREYIKRSPGHEATMLRALNFQMNALEGSESDCEVAISHVQFIAWQNGDASLSVASDDDHDLLAFLEGMHDKIDDIIKIIRARIAREDAINEFENGGLTNTRTTLN